MSLRLTNHFVAFVDVLGFSAMVQSDCNSAGEPKYLPLLHDAHLEAIQLLGKDLEAGLIQFSDSIVLSKPFDLSDLPSFLDLIAQWQRKLLLRGLLCRGGIAFGKHFVKDRFLFSKAMIDAYRLESSQAKFPRILVSRDLMDLALSKVEKDSLCTLEEEDGAILVNYLKVQDPELKEKLKSSVVALVYDAAGQPADVQEKLRWLARYCDFVLGTAISEPHFKS